MPEPVFVADIGGTNARFALAEVEKDVPVLREVQAFRAEHFKTLNEAAAAYLASVDAKPLSACFAVAGPVTDDVIEFTNSPWALDIEGVAKALTLDRLRVVNDFEALAAGVSVLKKDDFISVKPGESDPASPLLVLGPGTGLGQALLVPFGEEKRVVATEGGHVAFAPGTEEEIAVLQFLMREHGRVSAERLLSGQGIVNLYRALGAIHGRAVELLDAGDITEAAKIGADPVAVRAVSLFCELLGAVAGDAALSGGARGGVILGGGILLKIRTLFFQSRFVERFLDKGRMRDYLDDIPVRMIAIDGAALTGAAVMAATRV